MVYKLNTTHKVVDGSISIKKEIYIWKKYNE